MVLLCLALSADALIGNVQEKAMRQHEACNAEVIFYNFSLGSALLALGLAASGALAPGLARYSSSPSLLVAAVVHSVVGYLGMQVTATSPLSHSALLI